MTVDRQIVESPMGQGVDEIIAYTLTTTPWGGSPTGVAVVVKDITTDAATDVTTTVMPVNSPTVSGDVITLSPLKLLTIYRTYRIEIKFTAGGNTWEAYCIVPAEM